MLRQLPESYVPEYAKQGVSIRPDIAFLQFSKYADTLSLAGLNIHILSKDDSHFDSVFIEDDAVVWENRFLACRLPPPREHENAPVVEYLSSSLEIVQLPEGAYLEGGDVLHIEEVTYAGLSKQTNKKGVDALRHFLFPRPVIEVPVERSLHLKSVVTYLGNGTIIAVPEAVDLSLIEVNEVIFTGIGEPGAANCLRINDHLLIAKGNPLTEKRLSLFCERAGIRMISCDISEFEKGEGSLTCLSIIY